MVLKIKNLPKPNFASGTEFQAAGGQTIHIEAIHADVQAIFKAFVTGFTDKYSTNYNSEEVYGRMDPVQMYKNTQRVISISFDVPSETEHEAMVNQKNCASLARMQYPVYDTLGNATSIKASPLFKIRFGNLISNNETGEGLVGTLAGFNYEVDTDRGFHIDKENRYFPKNVTVSLEFTVQHSHHLGFGGADGEAGKFNQFPYGGGKEPPSHDPDQVPDLNIQDEALSPEKRQAREDKLTRPRSG